MSEVRSAPPQYFQFGFLEQPRQSPWLKVRCERSSAAGSSSRIQTPQDAVLSRGTLIAEVGMRNSDRQITARYLIRFAKRYRGKVCWRIRSHQRWANDGGRAQQDTLTYLDLSAVRRLVQTKKHPRRKTLVRVARSDHPGTQERLRRPRRKVARTEQPRGDRLAVSHDRRKKARGPTQPYHLKISSRELIGPRCTLLVSVDSLSVCMPYRFTSSAHQASSVLTLVRIA